MLRKTDIPDKIVNTYVIISQNFEKNVTLVHCVRNILHILLAKLSKFSQRRYLGELYLGMRIHCEVNNIFRALIIPALSG